MRTPPHPTSTYRPSLATGSRGCPTSRDGPLPATCQHVPQRTGSIGNLIKPNGETISHCPAVYNVETFCFFLSSVWTGSTSLAIFFLKSPS